MQPAPASKAIQAASVMLDPVSETPRLDAEYLMAFALGIDRSQLLLRQRDLVTPPGFEALIARRMRHEPVAYITGHQAFWDLELAVTPDVLIPRADSETLIEAAISGFANRAAPEWILDLGTGSGALVLAALSVFPSSSGIGVDASTAALAVASGNAQATGLVGRARFEHGDWRVAGWEQAFGRRFDLILCNPPYVETTATLAPMVADFEPHSALFAGTEGLDDYRILLPFMAGLLAPDGIAIFEIGHEQAESVANLARESGLNSTLRRDLSGHPRCLILTV